MNEFDVIAGYFKILSHGRPEALGMQDDAALIAPPDHCEMAMTSDTLNAGIHFLPDAAPADIARKALRVNLSDLAAMGADPFCYQLCIAFPQKPESAWLEAFTGALIEDQAFYGIFCSGGDTTSTQGPLSISITALGTLPKGEAVKRSGARAGDLIVLTGSVGDAMLGLKYLRNEIPNGILPMKERDFLISRYLAPSPRTEIAALVRRYATAAADISDGLVADLGHICTTSQLTGVTSPDRMKFSDAANRLLEEGHTTPYDLMTGGDDYELVMAVPEDLYGEFAAGLRSYDLEPQVIGHFEHGPPGVIFETAGGRTNPPAKTGWTHF